jgi:hypothetical protein
MDYSHNMSVIARQPYILPALFQLLLYSQNERAFWVSVPIFGFRRLKPLEFNESPFGAFWVSGLCGFRGFLGFHPETGFRLLFLNFIF